MNEVTTLDGEKVTIGTRLLAHLAALDDDTIRDCGYEPASVRAAVRAANRRAS